MIFLFFCSVYMFVMIHLMFKAVKVDAYGYYIYVKTDIANLNEIDFNNKKEYINRIVHLNKVATRYYNLYHYNITFFRILYASTLFSSVLLGSFILGLLI